MQLLYLLVMVGANQSSSRSLPDPDLHLSVVSTQSAMTVFFGFDLLMVDARATRFYSVAV